MQYRRSSSHGCFGVREGLGVRRNLGAPAGRYSRQFFGDSGLRYTAKSSISGYSAIFEHKSARARCALVMDACILMPAS